MPYGQPHESLIKIGLLLEEFQSMPTAISKAIKAMCHDGESLD
jgi:hypothetical protein